MRKIVVPVKTGFQVLSGPILLRDSRGIVFYSTMEMSKQPIKFNLPKGTYFIDKGGFTPLPSPIKYPLVKLPPKERHLPKPYNFNVVFGVNPNKCSILWNKKTILFDNSFKEKPLPQVDFVLFHEFAHASYNTEKYADLMAGNYMKVRGYNPSQIGKAPVDSLSEAQGERKNLMVAKLIEAQNNDKP